MFRRLHKNRVFEDWYTTSAFFIVAAMSRDPRLKINGGSHVINFFTEMCSENVSIF